MANADWTDGENDLIVADYFAMLQDELSGRSYNKAAHNRALQARVSRSKGSIEFKHQNISAVLTALGEVRINGYKPAFNYQDSLEDAVARWLAAHPDWVARPPIWAGAGGMADAPVLFLRPPPTLSNQPPPEETERAAATARRFDVAARDERNRALGRAGEKLALAFEKKQLRDAGRRDLADEVRWVSEEDGDGAGYDIASFTPTGAPRLVEVKTTNGWERTPFHISRNELAVSEDRREDWRLLRLWNFGKKPQAFEIVPPLQAHVSLVATSYQANFH